MFKMLENNSKNIYKKYSLIIKDSEFAFIKWYPQVITKIHDHKGKRCTYLLLNGPLIETIYHKTHNNQKLNKREQFEIGYIDDDIGLHSIQNPSNKNKYSLHYYR